MAHLVTGLKLLVGEVLNIAITLAPVDFVLRRVGKMNATATYVFVLKRTNDVTLAL